MTENEQLASDIIESAVKAGVTEFCLCPGARNSSFFTVLIKLPNIKLHFWFEERSAAFFALGKCKSRLRPVAVITTSGTAAGELLPAAMEAYYTDLPLLLITADRPRRFRGTGAPQAAEQVGLFGCYARFAQDVAAGEFDTLVCWNKLGPAHLNVCFEDPFACHSKASHNDIQKEVPNLPSPQLRVDYTKENAELTQFLNTAQHPFVVVGAIKSEAKDSLIKFLVQLNAPVFLEGISGLRENLQLSHLRITRTDVIWKHAAAAGYPIDGVLRIGGVPTFRLWRDLEEKQGSVQVCSLSDLPFSGLSWGGVLHVKLKDFFGTYSISKTFESPHASAWISADKKYQKALQDLILAEPTAEASLVHALSKKIPDNAHIYLGNSLPIREWDLAADYRDRGFHLAASRGVNGIDGQISTFLGWSAPEAQNWAILGDLTTLYDFAGLWILSHMPEVRVTLVVVNNGGGQIFSRLLPQREFLNAHELSFEPFAKMWGMHYERWSSIPTELSRAQHQLIEVIPDVLATERFQQRLGAL
jgi:2-succinyl-5-enolpyruvyl-6-hydroxy-3-cyclohexene-1-carboxylate synthase